MSELSELEEQLAKDKLLADKAAKWDRLLADPLFKELVIRDWTINEAASYAEASADPMVDAAGRADAIAMAQAPGHLKRFIRVIQTQGRVAARTLDELERAVIEARQEELEAQAEAVEEAD